MTRSKIRCGVAAAAMMLFAAAPQTASAEGGFFDGLYSGINLGYGEAFYDGRFQRPSFGINPDSLRLDGIAGGGQIGYNHLMPNPTGAGDMFLIGIEASVMGTAFNDRNVGPANLTTAFVVGSVDILADIRARLGVVNADILYYITGGVAFADADFLAHYNGREQTLDLSSVGGVVGAGAEFAINEMFSLRGEGLYYIFDKRKSINGASNPGLTGDFAKFEDAFVIRAGLNMNLQQVFGQ